MKPIGVSQLNRYIRTVFQHEPLLMNLPVTGEVTGLKYHSSGHVYFSLKDPTSVIRCFLPSDRVSYLRYPLEDGMEIVAEGYVSVYERGGYYSLNVRNVRIEGEGDLAAAFEALKQKLSKEGLFDEKYKKPIPRFPGRIGVVTSSTGAAVQDILRTIRNKNRVADVVVCPCLVQGDGAAGDIQDAIRALNRMADPPDVLIVGRGGGSMEDLWAFNEERVARSIFESRIPVISAVGHETDFTIADFVADVRAATPTAAAELAAPDIREWTLEIGQCMADSRRALDRMLDRREEALLRLSSEHLRKDLEYRIRSSEEQVERRMQQAAAAMKDCLHREELKIERLKSQVESMDPLRILERGYGVVTDEEGKFLRSVQETAPGHAVRIRMTDGELDCRVETVRPIHRT